MKDASSDVQEKMKQELENAAPSAGSDVTDDGDEHIVLEEYLSDTEQQKNSDSEDEAEDENDHITKVTVLWHEKKDLNMIWNLYGMKTVEVPSSQASSFCITFA